MSAGKGSLFVLATPIGNLKDITIRAVDCLRKADLVAAEDTRRTRKLLSHLEIRKKIICCNEHNELEKTGRILALLEEGRSVALVSDAGTPGLSDPGARLVAGIRSAGLEVIPVPGPSAVTAALMVSGFPCRSFYFAGFLPAKSSERIRRLKALDSIESVLVFFEAPHRLKKSLRDMLSVLGDRKVFLAREMTKRHETYLLSTVSGLGEMLGDRDVRGEITIIVQGCGSREEKFPDSGLLEEVIRCLISSRCLSVKQVSRTMSELTGVSRGNIYRLALEVDREQKERDDG